MPTQERDSEKSLTRLKAIMDGMAANVRANPQAGKVLEQDLQKVKNEEETMERLTPSERESLVDDMREAAEYYKQLWPKKDA